MARHDYLRSLRTHSRISGRSSRLRLEQLEDRLAPSVTVSGGVLQITGDDLANSVVIRLQSGDTSTTEVVFNNEVFPVANSLFSAINAQLLGGNDSLGIDGANGNPIPSGGFIYDGGLGTDLLQGPDSASTWSVTASNRGTLNSSTSFLSVEKLRGGTAEDTFRIGALGSLASSIDGSDGTNTIDFSARTSTITVNLSTGLASHVSGGISNIANVITGSGADTLTGNSLNNVLQGGAGNDTYGFDTDAALGSDTISDASGIDSLNFSSTTTTLVTVNLATTGAQTVNPNLTLTLSAANIENVTGGSLADSLTGNALNNTLTGGPGNDNLDGAAGDDTYVYLANSAQGGDRIIDASGVDRITFAGTNSAVSLDLSSTAEQAVNANLKLTLASGSAIENLTGGNGSDILIGNALINSISAGTGNDTLTGGGGNDALDGGAGDDLYLFRPDSALGIDSLTDASGTDTIDFRGTAAAVSLNLSSVAQQAVNSNLTLVLASAVAIENLFGGNGSDTLTGNTLNNTLVGGPGNDVVSGGAGIDTFPFAADTALGNDTLSDDGTGTITFVGTTAAVALDLASTAQQTVNANLKLTLTTNNAIQILLGGAGNDILKGNSLDNRLIGGAGNDTLDGRTGNDTYVFVASSALGSDSITDAGGIDTIDFTGTTSALTFNLSSASQQPNGNLTLAFASGTAIENAIGGSAGDVLTGNALDNTLIGGPGNDNLDGGAGNDTYAFDADTALGNDSIADPSGVDTLNFAASAVGVVVNLSSTVQQTVNGNLKITLDAASTFENLIGGSGSDTLTGNDLSNTLVGNNGNDTLNGGGGNDTYAYVANSQLATDKITDAAGTDTITFAGTTGAVSLNLASTLQQTVNANLKLILTSDSAIEDLTGGSGADTLKGNALNNTLIGGLGNDILDGGTGGVDTLIGGDGNDKLSGSGILLGGAGIDLLTGGSSRSLLIGGAGDDTITGGPAGDIIIGGTTDFDADLTALAAILAEWQSANSYSQRIANLRSGVGSGGAVKLIFATTVHDDGGSNTLRGQPVGVSEPGGEERDWFFSNFGTGTDMLPDKDAAEVLNNN